MKSTMFECNQDLVKANCSLQDWQQYLDSFNGFDLSLPSTTSWSALNTLSAGAIFAPQSPQPETQVCLTQTEEASSKAMVPLGTTKFTENDFSFDLHDYDSWEGFDPQKSNEEFFYSNNSDFDRNFDEMFSDDTKEKEKSSSTTAENLSLKSSSEKKKKQVKNNKQIRWRKENDKVLFRELTFIVRKYSLTIDEFISISKSGQEHPASNELFQKIQWKGANSALIDRICKLKDHEEYLSYRDLKQLRKLYYQQLRNQNVDWDFLLFTFPGRKLEYIKEKCYSFPRRESILEKSSTQSS